MASSIRAGLLERAEDDADRRRTIVRLPDEHQEVIGGWAQQALAPLRSTLQRLPTRRPGPLPTGWRILHEEATRTAPLDREGCAG